MTTKPATLLYQDEQIDLDSSIDLVCYDPMPNLPFSSYWPHSSDHSTSIKQKGKYHCTAILLFDMFGLCCFPYVELSTDILVMSNPNHLNRRSAIQWYSILWIRYLYLIVSTKSQISISEPILGDLVALLWPNAQLAFLYVVTPILQLFSINYPTNRASWNDYTNKMTHFYFRAYSRRPRNAAPLPSGKPEDALRGHRVTIQYVPKQFT